jgi:tripartite-type tricarboxylate transporter receptor subunit TctC
MPTLLASMRSFLLRRLLACGVALLVGIAASAQAQTWPTRSIKLIVPAAPGGSADPIARLVGEELTKAIGQAVVVENRPGANGNIGAASAAKAAPDGYTLLLGWPGTLVSAVTLYDAKPFHPERDFEPIVLVGSVPNVIVTNPSLPVTTLKELTDYAKKHPAQLNFGSTGSGSSYHLSGELYKKTNGVFMLHVPYSSPGAVFTDLLADRLQLAFPGSAAAAPFVKDGKLRVLAVMSDRRAASMPSAPTTKELGYPGLVSETWFALLAPKGTPREITNRINEVVNAALGSRAFKERLENLGFTPLGGKPERLTAAIRDDIVKWGEVVKFSGAKVD